MRRARDGPLARIFRLGHGSAPPELGPRGIGEGAPPPGSRHKEWLLALASCVVAVVLAEAVLRLLLFHTPLELAAKNPDYYAFDSDELWVYRYLFSSSKRWAIAADVPDASHETAIAFYRKWATSLTPDAELGWVRKPNVRIPCHETTNLATRGTRDYGPDTPRLLVFGDSFVESAACSDDTLTTKIEKATGIDTLNYGVGGYGLDQILLYVKRSVATPNRGDRLVLIGLIQDDLDRMLLRVRDGPKPYFTVEGGRLVLHTEHIHAQSLNDVFQRPPARFYLYYFVRGRLGFPYYREVLERNRDLRRDAVQAIASLIVREFADLRRQGRFGIAFFILPTPGAPFDRGFLNLLHAQRFPVIDLQGCLAQSGIPDTELFAELHPTSAANEILANCLVQGLTRAGLLR